MLRTLHVGERVRLHPATDWFMQGITHAVVTSKREINGQTIYYLRCDTFGVHAPRNLRIKLMRDYIIAQGDTIA